MGAYVIAKAALKSMLSVCAAEYPWLKVRTIYPGFTKTKMLDTFDMRYLELAQAKKPFSSPEDIATLIIKEIVS
jgi:3-oxoacyl-[acyl-carrier protein] reductase